MPPNPGVTSGGSPGRMWNDPGGQIQALNAPGFNVETKGLDQVSSKIKAIVTDIGKLDKAIEKLTTRMDGLAKSTDQAFGGGQQGTGTRGGNSAAPVSAFANKTAQGVALGAVGEFGTSLAGQINTYMGNVQSGGMGIDTMARQTNAVFGGGANGPQNTVNSITGISNLSPKDLTQAYAMLQSNPLLWAGTGSKNSKNLKQFLNTTQKLNPGMGATGAMQLANALTSNQAQQFLQSRGYATGGIYNARTGGINNATTAYKSILQALTGDPNLSATRAKALAMDPARWTAIVGSAAAMGLSATDMEPIRQFAAAGLNMNAAMGKGLNGVGGAVAQAALKASTANTRRQAVGFEAGARGERIGYQTKANANNAIANWEQDNKAIMSVATVAAQAAAALAKVASTGFEVVGMFEALKGLKGLLGGKTIPSPTSAGPKASAGPKEGPSAPESSELETVAAEETGGSALGPVGLATVTANLAVQALYKRFGITGAPGGVKNDVYTNEKNALSGSNMAQTRHLVAHMVDDALNAPGAARHEAAHYLDDLNPFGDPLFGMGDPITGATSTQGMRPSLAKRISAMRAANPNIRISSGHRSAAQQAMLYALKGGRGVAKPGQSRHQTGQAADLGPPSQFAWIAKNAAKFGLKRPAPRSEPWHVETMGDAVSSTTGAAVVAGAQGFLGVPYSWGGGNASGPTLGTQQGANTVGLDCSGLVVAVYGKLGIPLPRTSQQQAKAGKAVPSLAQAQPGDLLLYNYGGLNDHVAIYIGGGKQIAAPQTGQVVQVQSVDKAHLSCIRRIVGGGQGAQIVQAAQTMVGTPSSDSANHAASSGTNVGLTNTFIEMVNAGGAGILGGTPTGSGGGRGGSGGVNTGVASTGSSSTSSNAVSTGSGGRLSASQVYHLAMGAGLSASAARIATAVADVESRFNPTAVDHDSNGTTDYGLWQINSIHGVGTNMFNPSAAAKKMAQMTNNGTSWGAWGPDFGQSGYGGNPPIGGKVAAALASLGTLGDPSAFMGDPMTSSGSGSMPSMSGGRRGGGGVTINLSMPIQLTGAATQQDAQSLVQMVLQELKNQTGNSMVSGS